MHIGKPYLWMIGVFLPGIAPCTVLADSTAYVTPSISVGRAYDDNLFFMPSATESSALWRISPGIEAGYLSEPLTLAGFFTVDAERYNEHPELNGNAARRDEALDIRYTGVERLSFSMDADYLSTDTPIQVSPGTGLGLGRTRARVYTADPALAYRLDPQTTGRLGYTYEEDDLAGGPDTLARTASLGLDYTTTERLTWSFDYADTAYDFAGSPDSSRVLTAGIAYQFTPYTKFTLAAGPRDTDGQTSAEITASLRQGFDGGNLSLDYARSQAVILGQSAPVDTRSYSAALDLTPSEAWEILVTPSLVVDNITGSEAYVYRFGTNLSYKFNRFVTGVCTYQYSLQRGLLGGSPDEQIVDNVIFVGLVFSFPGATTGSGFQARQSSPFETLWPAPRH
jgi:hypothetical protein